MVEDKGKGRHHKRPSHGKVTLSQLAQAAGVSLTTASFIMSGRDDQRISRETATRVKKIAREMGYRPNPLARTLRTGKSEVIGLLSDYLVSTSHANAMISGAIDESREFRKLLMAADYKGDEKLETQLAQSFLDRQVDGIVFATMFTRRVKVPDILSTVPLVLLNCVDDSHPSLVSILPDEEQAGRDAARLLLDHGHTDRIAFAGNFSRGVYQGRIWKGMDSLALQERLAGIEESMAQAGHVLWKLITSDEWDIKSGRTIGREVCGWRQLPTAIICANDELAVGVFQALWSQGIRVPEDISLVSFDGSELAQAAVPQISSFQLPHQLLGTEAVRALLGKDKTRLTSSSGRRILISMPLIEGNSVAVPRM